MSLQNMATSVYHTLKCSFKQEMLGKLHNLYQTASSFVTLLVLPALPQSQIHQQSQLPTVCERVISKLGLSGVVPQG